MTMQPRALRVLIVDDEVPARRLLKKLLQPDSEIEVIGECGDGENAVRTICQTKPDLVFLDIQMSGFDGFEVLASIGATYLPAIIFVTAFDRYAVRAFEAHALDYLLKPFTRRRFEEALARAKELLRKSGGIQRRRLHGLLREWQHDLTTSPEKVRSSDYVQRIFVKSQTEIVRLDLRDIVWFEAADHYVVAHTCTGKHLLTDSLVALERTLPPEQFVRIHRRAIVNRAQIQKISPGRFGSVMVTLVTGRRLKLSRSRRSLLPRLLDR